MCAEQVGVLDIYRLLDRSNCGACGLKSCMAFAAAAAQGSRKLKDCPHLMQAAAEAGSAPPAERGISGRRPPEMPEGLKERIAAVDFVASQGRLGARLVDGRLAVKCLGRDFLIDHNGALTSESHVNFWVHVPLLGYVLNCRGREPTGEWVKFDQLRDALSRSDFFTIRCENELKRLADEHGDLFFDILGLFGREAPELGFAADRVFRFFPLPRVPFLLSYTAADGTFGSTLSLYFDRATDDNLDVESLFVLGMGLVEMFKRITARHG